MLCQKIQKDLQTALKNRDQSRLSILRLLWDAIIKKGKQKRAGLTDITVERELVEKSRLTDEEVVQLTSSLIKKSKEAIVQFEAGKRQDLADKEKKEIEILNQYLPEQLGEQDLRDMAQEVIKETQAASFRDTGKVMAALMPKLKGRADGGLVNQIVKELLSP